MSYEVLIAEDEATNRALLGGILAAFPVKISFAVDGQDCLDKIMGGGIPDLLLLDLMMPRKSGIEVLDELATAGLMDVFPIAVLSAKNEQTMVERVAERGIVDYILKPFDPQELTIRVADLLLPFDAASLKRLLEQLNVPDPGLFRQAGLSKYAQNGFDAFESMERGRAVCVLAPTGLSPRGLAKLRMEDLAGKVQVFRKRSGGWRRVWPAYGLKKI